jgi:MYXO-CTERM domain-containing protein
MRQALPMLVLLIASPAIAFEPSGEVWDIERGPVEYSLHPDGSGDIDDGSDLEAVRGAFDRWACADETSLRFRESTTPGVRDLNLGDGLNSVFWDENGSFGLGPATLGVTLGTAGSEIRDAADIVFNGFDHVWTTDDTPSGDVTDIESIAVHEVGHLLGLDHPCQDCPDQSVMTPTYPGGNFRALKDDDVDGVNALYPSDGESTCTGPFREGEFCACDDECIGDLVCAPDPVTGGNTCTQTCAGDDTTCPAAYACVLSAAVGGNPARGVCLNTQGLPRPTAAICVNDGDCAEGICLVVNAIGRTVCRVTCDADAECGDGYACFEGACVLRDLSIECPDGPPEGCGCRATGDVDPRPLFALGLLALVVSRGRRRSASRRGRA